ncbi:mobilization protein [Caulobacter sp. ErkDOM-E]|uniref:mobilization protein n=1 Tax=Caulobacter sp. ErkDOM-E TaxID=3402778 RepID=UPI003AF7334F
MAKTEAEKLERHERVAAQKKARAVLTTNRRDGRERKLDTRRKVILGSLLVDAAQSDPRWRPLLDQLMSRVNRPQDLKAFEGWGLDVGDG